METWIQSKAVYEGQVVSVRIGDVRMADGTLAFREVVEHPGGVAIVPILGASVILIRQYRIAVGREVLEVPAGKRERGDSPEERARRELEEETGYRAGTLIPLGSIFASVGYSSEEIHLFLAEDLHRIGQNLDVDERIVTVEIPIAEIRTRLINHDIQDAKTIAALYVALEKLK